MSVIIALPTLKEDGYSGVVVNCKRVRTQPQLLFYNKIQSSDLERTVDCVFRSKSAVVRGGKRWNFT